MKHTISLTKMFMLGSVFVLTVVCERNTVFAAGGAPEQSSTAPVNSQINNSTAEIQALADSGKYADAEKLASGLIKKGEQQPEIYNLLGFSLRKQKKWSDSVAAYRSALKIKPDYAQAKEYLAISYLNMKNAKDAKVLYQDLLKSDPELAKMIENEASKLKVKL